jgi:hypothetical protein
VVEHDPGVDFTWILQAARARTGETLSEPLTLRYSTAPHIGGGSVSGTLEPASRAAKAGTPASVLVALAKAIERAGILDAYRERLGTSAADGPTAAKTSMWEGAGAHTRIFLLRDFTSAEAEWTVSGAAVSNAEEGPYTIEYVRPGTYWPIAVRFTDATATEIEAIGFYDADLTGEPSPVTIGDGRMEGVDIALQPFGLSTARESLASARQALAEADLGHRLISVTAGYGARPSGKAYAWTYWFLSEDLETMTTVTVDPAGSIISGRETPAYARQMQPLGQDFLDSDEALAIARGDGGDAFLLPYDAARTTTAIEGGNHYWKDSPDPTVPVWRVEISATTHGGTSTFLRHVDMATGAVVTSTDPSPPLAQLIRMGSNYPNPFSGKTRLPFDLEAPATVTLEVFDLLGRRIATVLDGSVLPAGRHEVEWAAARVPAGSYLFRLSAGGATFTRTMVVVP